MTRADFERLLRFLQRRRGFDFTGYKRPSLMRRVERRLQRVGAGSVAEYLDFVQARPEELAQLIDAILVGATCFFRDPPAWEYLRSEVVPMILAGKRPHDPVRVWSAGCASGEEACSLAMVFAEAMGAEAFRERVEIHATDANEEALARARSGSYTARAMEALEPALRERYFEMANGRYTFRGDLRRSMIFGRHDLLQDAPLPRLDLIACRNTLMYFNAETQTQVLQRFHSALRSDRPGAPGFLFLGRAEMLFSHAALFSPLELKRRLFARVTAPAPRVRHGACLSFPWPA